MSMITADLAALLGTVRRPGDFFAAGTAELLAPLVEVEGVGPVALPLLPMQARQLIAAAEPAPYGRGEETVVDPAVRRCWQIGPDRVRIGGRHWARTLETILARVAEGLGVDAPIEAEFYKLLLYDESGFFVGHRDTEKAPGMFATLVVALPSSFAGGELVVRHKGREVRLDLRCDDPAEAAFAAFYADCVHEVLPVTEGCRLTLVYNLVRRGRGRTPEPPDYAGERARVATLLQAWRDAKKRPGDATGRNARRCGAVGRRMDLAAALSFLRDRRNGVITTQQRDGRPQLSNIVYWLPQDGVIRISATDGRAKTANLRRDARASLHVTSDDFWSYVVVEAEAEVTPVATAPDDPVVDELVEYYRALSGEHPDWDDYRRSMVADGRLVLRLRPERAYGMTRG